MGSMAVVYFFACHLFLYMQGLFRDKSMLLIFDNAEKADIKKLRPGGNKCSIIVTTRDRGLPVRMDIPDEGRLDLPVLEPGESIELLERLMGVERVRAEADAANTMTQLVGHLPLALEIIGKQLKTREHRTLSAHAESFKEERERLKKLEFKFKDEEELNVRTSLSLSVKDLENQQVEFFAFLSVCSPDGFSINAAMATGDCDRETAEEQLDYLYQLSLLNRSLTGENRYIFHPLILLYAGEILREKKLKDAASN